VIDDLQLLLPLNDHRHDTGGFSTDPADVARRLTTVSQQIEAHQGSEVALHELQRIQRYLQHELAWLEERGL
jgi:hypothetical protein